MIKGWSHREAAAQRRLLKTTVSSEVRQERAQILQATKLRQQIEAAREAVKVARSGFEAVETHAPEKAKLVAAINHLADLELAAGQPGGDDRKAARKSA
jgi:hypothetical protein